eukprot:304234_1
MEGVSAIDFGSKNRESKNQPKSFRELIKAISANGNNPGECSVSIYCYQPQNLMNKYILPLLNNLSQYITVYDRTVIIKTTAENNNKYITSVNAIQRKPINSSNEWTYLFSKQFQDWYSPNDSKLFTKTEYKFNGKIFIEASEFGDIILTSNINVSQGVETPIENSTTCNEECGQALTFTFFVKLLSYIPNNYPIIPPGNGNGEPYTYNNKTWLNAWIYRRAFDSNPSKGKNYINYNDITQQNWGGTYSGRLGNDYDNGYILLPIKLSKEQVKNGNWSGGINITALSEAEQRAFGWYHYFINTSNESNTTTQFNFTSKQLIMDINQSETAYGLSKYPYFRDTRRPYGLFGFKLNHSTMLPLYNETSKNGNYNVGYKFKDRIAIGNYPFDMHLLYECLNNNSYPNYINQKNKQNVPFYIPFRSIANNELNNLLFAGKVIAQSFYANAATREHPTEWNTGVAAGGTAFYMIINNINDSETVYNQIEKLQQLLQEQYIDQPLDWM